MEDIKTISVISLFRREVDENWALPGYDAASCGHSLPTFRHQLSVPSSLYDGTDSWSRNVGKELTTVRCEITQKDVVLKTGDSFARFGV